MSAALCLGNCFKNKVRTLWLNKNFSLSLECSTEIYNHCATFYFPRFFPKELWEHWEKVWRENLRQTTLRVSQKSDKIGFVTGNLFSVALKTNRSGIEGFYWNGINELSYCLTRSCSDSIWFSDFWTNLSGFSQIIPVLLFACVDWIDFGNLIYIHDNSNETNDN